MKVCLNRKHLDDGLEGIFKLSVEPTRVSYVPKDEGDTAIGERGLPEYIFAYPSSPPTPISEPELYVIPHEEDVKKPRDEVWLKYQKATVILISEKEDDRFRRDNKDLIERLEALSVDST